MVPPLISALLPELASDAPVPSDWSEGSQPATGAAPRQPAAPGPMVSPYRLGHRRDNKMSSPAVMWKTFSMLKCFLLGWLMLAPKGLL